MYILPPSDTAPYLRLVPRRRHDALPPLSAPTHQDGEALNARSRQQALHLISVLRRAGDAPGERQDLEVGSAPEKSITTGRESASLSAFQSVRTSRRCSTTL